ncbi:endonuclease domain-containing protein [Mycolicibacterium pulveris]|uniref:endonuclease domain-containing protein n=1 Tax=Mycolicibacterium pulveris TaxID=36813 RepID=UPI003CF2F037
MQPFVGTEAVAAGVITRYQLAMRYDALFRNVYVPKGQTVTPVDKAIGAWLWSARRATVAGLSAAALHGAKWIDGKLPAELNQASRHKTNGILLHSDTLHDDERCLRRGVPTTTAARTAFDLGRRGGETAVIRLDALMQATGVKVAAVKAVAERHRGARGLVNLRDALELCDAGAESPQETRTRLVLTAAGLRPTHTQIEVFDEYDFIARIDMGYPKWKVGVEYDGPQHWTDPSVRSRDIDRQAELEALRWRIIRVNAEMLRCRRSAIVTRTRAALRAAGAPV